MGGEISDTSNGVALYFDVGTEHLADEGFESTQLDNEQLVLGYLRIYQPDGSQTLSRRRTIHCQIA